jgi:hypothetical protein
LANNSIGKAALILTTNDRGLGRGLDGAYSKLQGFKTSITSSFSNLAIGGALTSLIGGGKIVGDLLDSIREKADLSQQARSLGIPVAAFQAIKAAAASAAVDVGGLTEALINMSGKIAEANAGNQNTAAAFRAIGLEAAALRGKRLDQQFLEIAGALGRVQDSGTRARMALAVLGEEAGKMLLPVLAEGTSRFERFAAEQKRTGEALSQSDALGIERARAALPRIGAAFDGAWTRIVVAAAPSIERVAGVATRILTRLQPLFNAFAEGVSTYYEIVGSFIGEVIDLGSELVSELSGWLGDVFPEAKTLSVREMVFGLFEGIGVAGGYAWDTLKAGAGAFVLGVVGVSDAVTALIEVLADLVDLAGDLPSELGGATFERWAMDLKSFAKDRAETSTEDLRAWGTRQMEAFGNSQSQVHTWFAKLRAGKQDIEQAADKVNAAAQQLGQVLKPNAALDRGSKEDFSARVQWQFQNEQADKNLAEARKVAANTAATVDAVRGLGDQLWRLAPLGGV